MFFRGARFRIPGIRTDGVVMSSLKAKVMLALILALGIPEMVACTTPVTVDCTPYTCVG